MANKKYSFNFFQVYENDALRDYLEYMAQKGWRLTKVSSMLLHFESCEPHAIRYCVEIMEKPSVYASNQTLPLKRYREFCKDAGWHYIGTNGLLHIFCTEDAEAIPVETDAEERFERILRACTGNNRMIILLFSIIGFMNLISCWQKRTLLCSQGFIVFILLLAGIYYIGDFQLWRRRASAALIDTGTLPRLSWGFIRTKNNVSIVAVFAACILFLLYTGGTAPSEALPYLLLYLAVYVIMMVVFSRLLYWLREKKDFGRGTNILIYWGFAALVILFLTAILSFALFAFLNIY